MGNECSRDSDKVALSSQKIDDRPPGRGEVRAGVPKHLLGLFRRAARGRSRKAAIMAHCIECMGYRRADVTDCTSTSCPLYPYRPIVKHGAVGDEVADGE